MKASQRQHKILAMIPRAPGSISTTEIRNQLRLMGVDLPHWKLIRDLNNLEKKYDLGVDRTSLPFEWCFRDSTVFSFEPTPGNDSSDVALGLLCLIAKRFLPASLLNTLPPPFSDNEVDDGPDNFGPRLHELKKVAFLPDSLPLDSPDLNLDVLGEVARALKLQRQVLLDYRKEADDSRELIIVEPIRIQYYQGLLWLIAVSEVLHDTRRYALSRVERAVCLEMNAPLPAGNAELSYANETEPTVNFRALCERAHMRNLLEVSIGSNQQTDDVNDEFFHLSVTVSFDRSFQDWLLAKSPYLDVLEPVWLRSWLQQKLRRSLLRSESYEVELG
jgi:hypothetical protein